MKRSVLGVFLMFAGPASFAGEADVLGVEHVCTEDHVCSFSVTVQHEDAGWDHYADAWEIVDLDGNIIATRVLAHPHDNEQPFTRSLEDVPLAGDMRTVIIRSHDSVHGYGGKQIVVRLFD